MIGMDLTFFDDWTKKVFIEPTKNNIKKRHKLEVYNLIQTCNYYERKTKYRVGKK